MIQITKKNFNGTSTNRAMSVSRSSILNQRLRLILIKIGRRGINRHHPLGQTVTRRRRSELKMEPNEQNWISELTSTRKPEFPLQTLSFDLQYLLRSAIEIGTRAFILGTPKGSRDVNLFSERTVIISKLKHS